MSKLKTIYMGINQDNDLERRALGHAKRIQEQEQNYIKNYIKEAAIYKILFILQNGIINHTIQHDRKPIERDRRGWDIDEELVKAVQEFINLPDNLEFEGGDE